MGTDVSNREIESSPWGWITLGAVAVSIVGFIVQSIFDYVPAPGIVGFIAFYVFFGVPAIVALVSGGVAVATGWRRGDHTARFGFVGLAYFVLAQTVQSIWDVVGGETDLAAIATFVVAALAAATAVVLVWSARRASS